jgi:anti-sigma factor RsiW
MNCREAEPLLNAYLDGELDLVHAREVEAHTVECAACRAALERHRQLGAAVSRAPYYRAAPSLRERIGSSAAPVWHRPVMGLALVASLFVGVLIFRNSDHMESEIVQAHLRSLRAGHLVDIAASGRTMRPWFAGRLDYALNVENISGRGFTLSGARLDSVNRRTVAVLVYQRGPHVVNVFVWPAAQRADQSPAGTVLNGLNLVNWRADGMNWWAISDLDLADLEELPLCPCFMPVHETLRG